LALGNEIVSFDPSSKSVSDFLGEVYTFHKLLLATGGAPYKLEFNPPAPDGINYFRNIDDYQNLLSQCKENSSATIVGGGFIGVELAAALTKNNIKTTLIFPEPWPCHRIFPAYLGLHILDYYRKQGVTMITEDKPVKVLKNEGIWNVETVRGLHIESNIVVAGIGIAPSTELAGKAGLKTDNGIIVDAKLRTSHPDIYAAGDNARYPDKWLGMNVRTEHWDNALNQGKLAGRNMAGANESYQYMPYFFSDMFDFGFEAVGNIDSKLETFADWREENEKGVIYYLQGNKIKGIMLCNVWDKIGLARTFIQKGEPVGAIANLKNKIAE
jgi:NADPH-dependent 2,4-dienoyl-CoA reductase/sulfur reductase-like enzyme